MIRKYVILFGTLMVTCAQIALSNAETLPAGSTPDPIPLEHFPDRMHAFVWRNWEMVSLGQMAKVLQTTDQNVRRIGHSMGLPPQVAPPAEYQQRGYISIIRRNWHLLPYQQLLELLGWDEQQLAFTLREDDFLWIKLGALKPSCKPILYNEPDDSAASRCEHIRSVVEKYFGESLAKPCKPRFILIPNNAPPQKENAIPAIKTDKQEPVRFLYSYFGVFGDPLLNPDIDPYPDNLLQQLSSLGVNGVWLHVVLRQLAPGDLFSDSHGDHQIRIANLRKMVDRAKRHGIDIYLYINEPRAMPESFFHGREHIKGAREGDHCALCTSSPQVTQWIENALACVFRQVPDLAGVFTITASENLTNCYSHSRNAGGCPRCSKRSGPEVIAEINKAIAAGVWKGSPQAKVIVWDWGWPDGTNAGWGKPDWAEKIIQMLPDKVYLMSVSEWGKPIKRGNVPSAVGEYSISAVGPGPRALKHWEIAKKRGLKTIAKVQVNCTWELSALPYLPVMNLIARHCENLAKTDINGLMLSWTVGGYPSPNLQLVSQFQREPLPSAEQALKNVAQSRYGRKSAAHALDAWSCFSTAFAEYPFDISCVYRGPTQYGPANLLYPEPTRYTATMIGFPYDDLNGWRGVYPPEVFADQFEKMTSQWKQGLEILEKVPAKTDTPAQKENARQDIRITKAAGLHFDSVANQIRFILARDDLISGKLEKTQRDNKVTLIRNILTREINNAALLFELARDDPKIGFEASNQYYYTPLDLAEKVINCDYILNVSLPHWAMGENRPQ
ncbi:MAG: hypothetical protein JW720_08060 [Sedimentisphaerales bacterium]|nr:hypothetical protein [Sedimentisphaerales bacterium]